MGFFKLGKLDKGGGDADNDKDKKKKQKSEDRMANEAPSSGSAGVSSGPSVNDFISKTKSQQRQGLKPSGPELIAYARYLGIDPVADHDLLWIAVEALEAPLPCEWTEHFDSSDRVFYYNATTRVSSWTHPLEHIYRETYNTIINFRNTNLTPQERCEQLHELQRECQHMEAEVHHEITAWTEHTDEHNHKFYFNREERRSTWIDPRPAKCHILYLKMKMIRILSQHAGTNLVDGGKDFSPFTADNADRDPKRQKNEMDATPKDGARGDGHPSEGCPSPDGDPGSEGYGEKKKKKKKKKDKDRDGKYQIESLTGKSPEGGFGGQAAPPGRFQNLNHSQSEPAVSNSAKGMGSVGAGGLGAFPHPPSAMGGSSMDQGIGMSPSVPQPFGGFGGGAGVEPDSMSNFGRARPKAGLRLAPLSSVNAGGDMHGSASVPTLSNRQELNPI